ncbi:TerD family protein [Lutibacter sp. B2]|nr:TerD family protein [Lutibacter sp. B2]
MSLTIEPMVRTNKANNNISIDTGRKSNYQNFNIAIETGKKSNYIQNGNQTIEPNNSKKKNRQLQNKIDSSNVLKVSKGQKISLNQITSHINNLLIGVEWEQQSNVPFDIDISLFMVDENNKTKEEDFIFYNNLKSSSECVVLKSDHNTGLCNAFDEIIQLNLGKIPSNIQKIAVTATIDEAESRNRNFGQVTNGFLKMLDSTNKKELIRCNFTENLVQQNSLVIAEIYRYKGEWKINFIANGFNGGLKALCDHYGIETK